MGQPVSVIGLGTWQLGADWGAVTADDALAVLRAAADAGVTMFDTADVYGDGRSEQAIARLLREEAARGADGAGVLVATKMGRRVDQVPECDRRGRVPGRGRPARLGDRRPGRAALGHPAARRHHRHPRGAQRGAGPPERRRRGLAGTAPGATLAQVENLYDKYFRAQVHDRW